MSNALAAKHHLVRTAVVILFVLTALTIFTVLWAKSGGTIPFVTGNGYKLNAQFTNIENLAPASDVEMAGVPIGTVASLDIHGDRVDVHMVLNRNAPIHQGATVQIQEKTLVGETYISLTDGNGKALPSGTTIPIGKDLNYTSLNTLFDDFKAPTRQVSSELIDEFNAATTGESGNLSTILSALANVGSQGGTVFSVLSSQTQDLQQLVSQTATLLGVLDEGQGQIAQLSTASEEVSKVTAQESSQLADTITALPPLINAAHAASGSITTLSDALSPIATNLEAAAPALNQALVTLPSTTTSLRDLLPSLNSTLTAAPATLRIFPTTATDLTDLLPSVEYLLSNFDPMVAYLAPYKQDIGAFFANFAATTNHVDGVGHYGDTDLAPGIEGVDEGGQASGTHTNPIPAPGASLTDPTAPQSGKYPHVTRENP